MLVWVTKTIALLGLLLITVICGLIPLKLVYLVTAWSASTRVAILPLLNCFAGGVFLGTFMLHLQPEVARMTDQTGLDSSRIPFANLFIAAGFFLILILEQIFIYVSNRQKQKHGILLESPSPGTALEDLSDSLSEGSLQSQEEFIADYGSVTADKTAKIHKTRVTLFLIALSIHSLFEGLALGLQESQILVWTVFIAIATHKAIISFSTGLQLVRCYHPSVLPVVVGIVTLSAMTPVGTALGTTIAALGTDANSKTLVTVIAVLQALATGSFMFITFVEILVKHLRSSGHAIKKTIAVFIGFLCMAALLAVEGDS